MYDYGRKTIVLKNGDIEYTFDYTVIQQLNSNNQARISSAYDPDTRDVLKESQGNRFHLVTTFVPFDHEDVSKDLLINEEREPTAVELQARMSEVTDCLQRNLNHKYIAFVHVLVLREETITYLRMLDLVNSDKLIIHKTKETPTMKHEIMYASKYLLKKTVIISHQDNYLANGWERVDFKALRTTKLMYALTRHYPPSKCPATLSAAHCGPENPYMGSHDTFVFYVNEAIPDHELVDIDVAPNMSGIENILMWVFRKRLGYRVINPCKILIVYHNHCVSIREVGRERINLDKNTALAYFSAELL